MDYTIIIVIVVVCIIFWGWGLIRQSLNRDSAHIKKMLRQAAQKNSKVGTYMSKWRLWKIWFKVRRIHKINEEIIATLKKDPARFQLADKFFSLYLDSALTVLENYTRLVSQPVRNAEVQSGLLDAERALEDIQKGLEDELTRILHSELKSVEAEKEVLGKHIHGN